MNKIQNPPKSAHLISQTAENRLFIIQRINMTSNLYLKKNVFFKRPFKGVMDFYVFSASGSEEPAAIFWTEIKQKWKWVKRLLCPRDRLERLFLCVCVILILCEHEYLWIVFSSFCHVNTIYCISCFQCMSIKKVIQAQFGDCSGYLMKASTD